MLPLIQYEFFKMIHRKSTWMVMTVSLVLTVFLFGLPVLQFQTYNQTGVLRGLAAIEYEKELAHNYSVPLTDEYLTETIREVDRLFDDPNNVGFDGSERFLIGDAYWNGIAPREKLLDLIARNYAEIDESAGYTSLPSIDVSQGVHFYQARDQKIAKLLNSPQRNLSVQQKDYWQTMNIQVKEPFQYGYYEGWEIFISNFELLIFAILAVCIVIAPVFAGEYQAKTDAVILCTKYGKTKLPWAKMIASYLFGISAFTIHVLAALGVVLGTFGWNGWNLQLQIANTIIPYPLTFLQAALVNLGVVYLVLSAMMAFTLVLSAKMKSPYMVLVVLAPVLFIPLFLSPNGTVGLYNLVLFLLPYRAIIPEFGKYISYQFGEIVIDLFTMRAVVDLLLLAVLLPLANRIFRNHQVA